MTSSRRLAALGTLAFALSLPAVAHAQRSAQDIESARQLFNQGIDLRDKGDLKGALEKLRAAHALGNTPVTGIELCRTHAALRQPVEAREVCLGVARIPPLAQETPRSQEARAEAGRIAEAEKPKIGSVRIKVTGVPAGWEPTVLVDGAAIPAAALTESRAINPGSHVITAKVGAGQETRASFETKEGESRDVEMAVLPPPEGEKPGAGPQPGPSPGPTPPPPEKKHTFVTAMFITAGVSAGIGAIAGIAAISNENDLEDKCVDKQCGRELHDDLSDAKTVGNVSTAFFVISGIALGAGVIALVAAPSRSASAQAPRTATAKPRIAPSFGLGGVGLHGSF